MEHYQVPRYLLYYLELQTEGLEGALRVCEVTGKRRTIYAVPGSGTNQPVEPHHRILKYFLVHFRMRPLHVVTSAYLFV